MSDPRDIIADALLEHRHAELLTCWCGWAPSVRTSADLARHQAEAVEVALRAAGVTLYHGDALAVMPELRNNEWERLLRTVLTDPPF